MNNEIDEQWLEVPRVQKQKKAIIAISNTGKYRRGDGSEGILGLRQKVLYEGKQVHCSHIIAEHFLITVKRLDQIFIDHISHTPTEYNIDDVRNLRWCTKSENCNFEEAKEHYSIANSGDKNPMYGRTGERSSMYGRTGDKSPTWKGENVGPSGAYKRAKKLYKEGVLTKEEFQHYRDAFHEYQKARRSKIASPRGENLMD